MVISFIQDRLIYMPVMPLSSPIILMPDTINMPIHSAASFSLHPLLFLCGAASEAAIWLVHHALITV